MVRSWRFLIIVAIGVCCLSVAIGGCKPTVIGKTGIDRFQLVTRHNVQVQSFDTLSSLSVGNGSFALTVDATGLQTFPAAYGKGVSLGTQSDWGWHSFVNEGNFLADEAIKNYDVHGRSVGYAVQWDTNDRRAMAANYFRVNPHRLHLGMIGLEMKHADGSPVLMGDIEQIDQQLDLWKGIITSRFMVDGKMVVVQTVCHPDKDVIAVNVKSDLVGSGLMGINLKFPYPTGIHTDDACDWSQVHKHQSKLVNVFDNGATVKRSLDTTSYFVSLQWQGNATIAENALHHFMVKSSGANELALSIGFSPKLMDDKLPDFSSTHDASVLAWERFWNSGGAIDFSGSTNLRANELERRVVLSQYLTRIQCAGIYPPQETGLTFNSWFGKFHLEMDWWHGVHYALWNRIDILEKRLDWYRSVYDVAAEKAKRQGYSGVRWAKMTNPNGADSPSSIGEFLVWQQPHIIYFAELCYRHHNDSVTLKKYADLVFATADFMASYAYWDEPTKRYVLGPAVIPAQECFDPETTLNPPFELAYWRWGLQTALEWKKRMGLPVVSQWEKVLNDLAPLATDGQRYLVAENAPDTYTNPKWQIDHPMVLGVYGMLPATKGFDVQTMANSVDFIKKNWNWAHTWGWDYPMVAMNATRMSQPGWALDALMMDVQKNRYLKNGHNYQDERLRIYLPGNGGLLAAVAMMCAGFDGSTTTNPGFPNDGTWRVKWEGLAIMP